MIGLITNILPIILGFFAKLLAIRSQAQTDANTRMLELLAAKKGAIKEAREEANKESRGAALTRRVLVFSILGMIALYPLAGYLGLDTTIPVTKEGFSFLGIFNFADTVEMVKVEGLYKFEEIFAWCTMIVEFYFGAQLAKAR